MQEYAKFFNFSETYKYTLQLIQKKCINIFFYFKICPKIIKIAVKLYSR